MRKIISCFGFLLVLSLGLRGILLASESPASTPEEASIATPSLSLAETPTIPVPVLLKDSEKMGDSEIHPLPLPPGKNADGTPLHVADSVQIPRGVAIDHLADPSLFPQIAVFNKSEDKSRDYYWHSLAGVDYCHYRGGSGSHWYGWPSNGNFLWVLYHAGHFWWHDTYAERWLYFDRGCWRWQGPKKNQFQVYLEDGHYHACDAKGVLGEDLFTLGTEEELTQPVVKETVIPLSKQKEDNPGPGGSMEDSGHGALDSLNHH
jgi:hypothetical protein